MKRRHAGLLGLILAGLGLGWVWQTTPREPAPLVEETAASFPWHRAPATPLEDPPPATTGPSGPSGAPAAPAAPPAPAGPQVAELCGIGPVSLPRGAAAATPGFDTLPGPLGHQALALARERLVRALQASGQPRAAVAAHLLQRPSTDDAQQLGHWAQAVLQTALAHRDPVALGWAEEACGHTADGAGCRLKLIRARIAAEPDNAQHWAALADEDPEAGDEAWQGLAQARRWDNRPYALVATALQVLPPDVPAYLRAALAAELTTLSGSLPSPGEGFVLERCQAAVAGRAGECSALAGMLAAPGASPAALDQALRIARPAGWPAARIAQVRAAYESHVQAEAAWRTRPDQPLACDGVDGWLQQFEHQAAGPATLSGPR